MTAGGFFVGVRARKRYLYDVIIKLRHFCRARIVEPAVLAHVHLNITFNNAPVLTALLLIYCNIYDD